MNEKAESPPSTPTDEEWVVSPLKVKAKGEPLRATTAFHDDDDKRKREKRNKEHNEPVVPWKETSIAQSIHVDEDTGREPIRPILNHASNSRPPSFELYKDPAVLFWTETVASEAENMHFPIPNFSHPITISYSPPPQLPTPDLTPPYPPPAHYSEPTNPPTTYLQHPLQRLPKNQSATLETGLHSIYNLYTSELSKPYIADFPPPPTTAFPVSSPPQSHLNFSPPKPKERRTNWALEEHFPFTPLQRMKRKHRKRLYGALFAIFFVSTLGAGVGFLIHGVGDGKRAQESDQEGASREVPSFGNPNAPGTSVGASEGKKEHILWMVIIGGILMACHAIFAAVMFVLYGPCGTRRKKYMRDGRGGAVEVGTNGS